MVTRGGVFWLDLEAEHRRPVCVITRDEALPVLQNVVVALVTTVVRGLPSEVPIGREDGLPRDGVITLDNVKTVPKALLTERITQLSAAKMTELCAALNRASGC